MATATKSRSRRRAKSPAKPAYDPGLPLGCYRVMVHCRMQPVGFLTGWEGWRPDSPQAVMPDQTCCKEVLPDEFEDYLSALVRTNDLNRGFLKQLDDNGTPYKWATVKWQHDRTDASGSRLEYDECLSPAVYCTAHVRVMPGWRPRHWLDAPRVAWDTRWSQSTLGLLGVSATLDQAAEWVIRCNRKTYADQAVNCLNDAWDAVQWNVLCALEQGPDQDHEHVSFLGPNIGTFIETRVSRFHIVTPAWPFEKPLDFELTNAERTKLDRMAKAVAKRGRRPEKKRKP